MPRLRTPLTPQLADDIIQAVAKGAYPVAAGEAAGIDRQTLEKWWARGNDPKAREPYQTFARELTRVTARARVAAEQATFLSNPYAWIRHHPGACDTTKIKEVDAEKKAETSPDDALDLVSRVIEALSAFPQAKQHVLNTVFGTKQSLPAVQNITSAPQITPLAQPNAANTAQSAPAQDASPLAGPSA